MYLERDFSDQNGARLPQAACQERHVGRILTPAGPNVAATGKARFGRYSVQIPGPAVYGKLLQLNYF
jgi:hypothetical protein